MDLVVFDATRWFGEKLTLNDHDPLPGSAWQGGLLVFPWRDTPRGANRSEDGRNVIIQEFIHHIDGLDDKKWEAFGACRLNLFDINPVLFQHQLTFRFDPFPFRKPPRSYFQGPAFVAGHQVQASRMQRVDR